MENLNRNTDKMSNNEVVLTGFVGNNPHIYGWENGLKKAEFPMATHQRFKNKEGEWQDSTTWHRIVAWGRFAEMAESTCKKGEKINLTGKLVTRTYIDKKGNKRSIVEVSMTSVEKIEKSAKNNQNAQAA